MQTIVDSSNTDLNPIAIQALLRSVFDESTIITLFTMLIQWKNVLELWCLKLIKTTASNQLKLCNSTSHIERKLPLIVFENVKNNTSADFAHNVRIVNH